MHSELYDCSTEWNDATEFSGLFEGKADALICVQNMQREGLEVTTHTHANIQQQSLLIFFSTFVPCILILSEFFIHQLIHKWLSSHNINIIYSKMALTCSIAVTPSSGSPLSVLAKVTLC